MFNRVFIILSPFQSLLQGSQTRCWSGLKSLSGRQVPSLAGMSFQSFPFLETRHLEKCHSLGMYCLSGLITKGSVSSEGTGS